MIIAQGTTPEGTVLILGLSRENITRLTDGKPIFLSDKTHAIPKGLFISILFGDTEQSIALKLRASGMIDADCIVRTDPRLNQS